MHDAGSYKISSTLLQRKTNTCLGHRQPPNFMTCSYTSLRAHLSASIPEILQVSVQLRRLLEEHDALEGPGCIDVGPYAQIVDAQR